MITPANRNVASFSALAGTGGRAHVAYNLTWKWLTGEVFRTARRANGSWTAATAVTTLRDTDQSELSRGPRTIALPWHRESDWCGDYFTRRTLFVAVRENGVWVPARRISPNIEYAGDPSTAFAPDGRLVIAWVIFGYYRQTGEMTVRSRTPDGAWVPKTVLPPPPGSYEAQVLDLALDPTTGTAALVFHGDGAKGGGEKRIFHTQELAPPPPPYAARLLHGCSP